ncbi:tRNA (adenosine(37)-N6)-threonylcarbamoyltransferase complex transferase subunit TsaD [Desulfatiglans anilini]|uniref:tRNA (adenosine(37)-N6)-threonylcarbamoyltransferase complex transferase subunit TsaD n=1 Tax=Desulfatiglans anilini TaxID=90728 RepID=UPI0003FE074E|nr:tRNA (adenosine(37)-N6)-threonylcarbamoyltransferase complex transferase subunit TsaD [Desulfatiglans anilini]
MLILGIDTSCDDTSAGLLRDGREVLANVVHSQIALHHRHGGVVPELASREHLRNLIPVVEEALKAGEADFRDLDAIAVTQGPGLVGSLLVGLYYAKALAFSLEIPLIAVNHLEAHLLSIFLEPETPPFPYAALTVSGGHTQLYHVRGYGDYTLLGQTVDDAAGEAFDKVAKIFGLGYPGGRVIEALARSGDAGAIRFPRAWMGKESLDFSFSGLKTAVLLQHRSWAEAPEAERACSLADMAAAFQEAVVDVLVQKTLAAVERMGVSAAAVAGGVACNGRLRGRMSAAAQERGISVFYPRPAYCTDNGAMIALTGYHRFLKGETAGLDVDARSKFPMDDLPGGRRGELQG